jgi:drug/metabolite transporter (DMT)-like permease
MAPVGAVNAVSVVEAPMAAAAGRRLFRERLSMRQVLAGFVATVGVLATALSVPA